MAKIRAGKQQVGTDDPAHLSGVRKGETGGLTKQKGHLADGTSTAERSTGINPKAHEPIDPRMPNLSPP